jgi:LEA14-like dessication related protein
MRKLALALAVAVTAAACSHPRPKPPPPAPLPVALPLIAFEAAQLDEFQFTRAALTFRCRVDNPNPFPLSVQRVRFALQLDGRPAAEGEVESSFAIPAMASESVPGTGSITFPVVVRFGAVPGFAKVMASKKEAPYAVSGAVFFRTPYGIVDVPMATEGVLGLPRMPQLKVEKLVMRSASPVEVVLELKLRVGNTNGFPLPAARIDYALVVSDKEVARAQGRIDLPIAPGEAAETTIPIRISPLKAGKAAARFLLPFASLKAELKGGIDFEGVPIPLDLDADVLPSK